MELALDEVELKNWPLIEKVYDHILCHPEEWDQTVFADQNTCGTTFCFAGTAVAMTHDVTFDRNGNLFIDGHIDSETDEWDLEVLARRELGISEDEADELFYTMTKDPEVIRNILDVWQMAEK